MGPPAAARLPRRAARQSAPSAAGLRLIQPPYQLSSEKDFPSALGLSAAEAAAAAQAAAAARAYSAPDRPLRVEILAEGDCTLLAVLVACGVLDPRDPGRELVGELRQAIARVLAAVRDEMGVLAFRHVLDAVTQRESLGGADSGLRGCQSKGAPLWDDKVTHPAILLQCQTLAAHSHHSKNKTPTLQVTTRRRGWRCRARCSTPSAPCPTGWCPWLRS
jgi:hypothetical protein